jgi:mannose-6-phosphate isomerase-like protein (cupin superfamily)
VNRWLPAMILASACTPPSFGVPLIRSLPAMGTANPPAPGTARRLVPLASSGHMTVGMLRITRGALPAHLHLHADEVVYVVSGKARVRLGTESREVGPGDLMVIPQGISHAIDVVEDLVALRIMSPKEDPPVSP